MYPKESIQGSVLHVFCDDHQRLTYTGRDMRLNVNVQRTQTLWLTAFRFYPQLTSCDDALQPDDVRMVELSHDGGLGQEVPPLLVRVTRLQTLDGHVDLPLSLSAQPTTAHLPKLSYTHRAKQQRQRQLSMCVWVSVCVCVCVCVCVRALMPSLPMPITLSMWILLTSISLANSWMAWSGSS